MARTDELIRCMGGLSQPLTATVLTVPPGAAAYIEAGTPVVISSMPCAPPGVSESATAPAGGEQAANLRGVAVELNPLQ